ncbi:hypothetical protein C9994_10610 [Marivirga lumbricoides]|uniref:Uncharacterized protein n=1 Tax=Marivirga lumbricoides TaxID=1046115 RepID=A0A2T4DPG3_9BACT|nr:hypothetical protein C9994_10610 [Marivirga lumbricoides]
MEKLNPIIDFKTLEETKRYTKIFCSALNECKERFDLISEGMEYTKELYLKIWQTGEVKFFEDLYFETTLKKREGIPGIKEMSREGVMMLFPMDSKKLKLIKAYEASSKNAMQIKNRNRVEFECIILEKGVFVIDEKCFELQFTIDFKSDLQIEAYKAIKYLVDNIEPTLRKAGIPLNNTGALSVSNHRCFNNMLGMSNPKMLSERSEIDLVKYIVSVVK